MALPQRHRLRDRRLFTKLHRHGRRARSPRFTVLALAAPHRDRPSRFGISISKKVDKRAVVRNRLRRQIQGFLIAHSSTLAIGFAVVIIIRPGHVPSCNTVQILQELEKLLNELKILPNNGH